MKTLILSVIVTICVTTISVVFIVCFFKHLDSTGFVFQNKVTKDIQNLLEFETKANNTFPMREGEMMAMKERIDELEQIIGKLLDKIPDTHDEEQTEGTR